MPSTHLLVEGGGDNLPRAAITRFCGWCKARRQSTPFVLLIHWASARSIDEITLDYSSTRWFGGSIDVQYSPSVTEILDGPSDWPMLRKMLASCSGVFIGGGDQGRICDLFEQMPGIREHLQSLFESGLPFGGTSAGAAIMSNTMLTGEGGVVDPSGAEDAVLWPFIAPNKVKLRQGLGLTKTMVIDQHFVIRQRINRLLSVMITPEITEEFALGVDEDVAVAIVDGHILEILGASDRVAMLFQRVGSSRTQFITNILHASPDLEGSVLNLSDPSNLGAF
jgi:cyanophycinase